MGFRFRERLPMFRDMSIKKKLTVILMIAGTVAVLSACIVYYVMTTDQFRKTYEDDLTSLARILGRNCEASLAFRIPEEADHVLASLSVRPSVVYAVIRDRNDGIFAVYATVPWSSETLSGRDLPGFMKVRQNIEREGTVIGSLLLVDDIRGIRKARVIAVSMMIMAVLISTGVAFVMISFLQTLISKPILALSSAAEQITKKGDFSCRAEKHGNDEVGQLVDDFNAMIGQIEKRNEELIESEKRFRTLVDQAVDAFFLFHPEGRIVDVNQRACESLGYARDELLSLSVGDIDAGETASQSGERPWESLQPSVPVTKVSTHRRKNGSTFPVETRLGFLEIGGQSLVMGLARDISERREAEKEKTKLESQLQQAQKMEAIGVLAGGIAHDFNNILTAINGYAELAREKLTGESKAANYLDEVLRAGDRATELVKQILTFSRQTVQDVAPIELQPLIKEAVKLLRASIPSYIEIRLNISPSCGAVLANPTQIHQIVMNLCTNAYHAMRETGGGLGISLEELVISDKDVHPLLAPSPGNYVRLTVSDTGHGMDKATAERIFEPYFTTKKPGEGTGMGLSLVHGIVKSYGGHISVYSEPGKGTTFHVYIPKVDSAPVKETAAQKKLEGGTEHLLIVDDEQPILLLEEEMLSPLGYRITACPTAGEALEKFRASPASFDLVITDMNMPKILGIDLAREMQRIRPDIPIILCTGFSDRIDAEKAKSLGIREYIEKPIVRTALAGAIRRVLTGKTGDGTIPGNSPASETT
jgi:PAS domain S-box-containing protein